MKKILVIFALFLFTILTKTVSVHAEDPLVYPFDSITIVEAFKFNVEVTVSVDADSLLYGLVEVGEILTVYIGTLDFVLDGVPSSGSSKVLLISNTLGTDLVRFLVNNYSFYEGISQSWGFASHILIDPAVGVY
jgi:hypothetical protein